MIEWVLLALMLAAVTYMLLKCDLPDWQKVMLAPMIWGGLDQ